MIKQTTMRFKERSREAQVVKALELLLPGRILAGNGTGLLSGNLIFQYVIGLEPA
jgi:hypothetical protein